MIGTANRRIDLVDNHGAREFRWRRNVSVGIHYRNLIHQDLRIHLEWQSDIGDLRSCCNFDVCVDANIRQIRFHVIKDLICIVFVRTGIHSATLAIQILGYSRIIIAITQDIVHEEIARIGNAIHQRPFDTLNRVRRDIGWNQVLRLRHDSVQVYTKGSGKGRVILSLACKSKRHGVDSIIGTQVLLRIGIDQKCCLVLGCSGVARQEVIDDIGTTCKRNLRSWIVQQVQR